MSLTRRLAAGLPAVGVTVIAALALSGSPAAATGDESAAVAKHPAVMTTPCTEVEGEQCENASAAAVAPVASADDADVAPARGNGGYGPVPSTPPAIVDTVPPGGELPATSPAATPSTPSGVSAGGTLPLTGAPMGLTMSIGGLLVAGGVAAVYYSRRRRSA